MRTGISRSVSISTAAPSERPKGEVSRVGVMIGVQSHEAQEIDFK